MPPSFIYFRCCRMLRRWREGDPSYCFYSLELCMKRHPACTSSGALSVWYASAGDAHVCLECHGGHRAASAFVVWIRVSAKPEQRHQRCQCQPSNAR